MLRLCFCIIPFLLLACKGAAHDLEMLFSEHGVTGTLIVESLDGQTRYVYNPTRAAERFVPASTFKIPHTLIALDEGVIADENEIIPWDGVQRQVPAWNQDHCLKTAFPVSAVWFYQELVKRMDDSTYRAQLRKLAYGNMLTGPNLNTFWLDGDIAISAEEQIDFLKKLYRDELPYRQEHLDILKRIMIMDHSGDSVLRGKTGWAGSPQEIGWYVGYLDSPDGPWFFAMNMDMNDASQAVYRQEIVMAALQELGLYISGGS